MTAATNTDRVWELVEKVRLCMLSTQQGEDIRARPMLAYADRDAHAIFFLSDADSLKDEDIKAHPGVGLAFADTQGQNYVSISGQAQVHNDRGKIAALWATPAQAWWDSPDDPAIRVLLFTPDHAQYWDGFGSAESHVRMAAAAAAGERPNMGEHGRAQM